MTKVIPSNLPDKPWYKEFWPWFIIALLATVVSASLITVSIAFRHADDLVVDDYYKVGLAINQRIEHREAAARLGIKLDLKISGQELRLRTQNIDPSTQLSIVLAHPMEADKDFTLALLPGPDGLFFATMPRSISRGWHWAVSAHDPELWLISGVIDAQVLSNGDS